MARRISTSFAKTLTACVWLAYSPLAQAQTAHDIAKRAFASVVLLLMEDTSGQPVSLGSGFVVDQEVVVSNLHVIEGASRGHVKLIGKAKRYEIEGLIGLDAKRDLALLRVPGLQASPLLIDENQQATVGDEIYAVGNPRGLEGTFSSGIISGIRELDADTLLQITAPISPGSSGGPILNKEGKVVGVAVATYTGGQNLNFAIPGTYVRSLIARRVPVAPLAARTTENQASILRGLGGGSITGVKGSRLVYDDYPNSGYQQYSFSLRNNLRETVSHVYCLVVFYDLHGEPIETDAIMCQDAISGGLAKRVTSRVAESVRRLAGVQPFEGGYGKGGFAPQGKVQIRVLDFQVGE